MFPITEHKLTLLTAFAVQICQPIDPSDIGPAPILSPVSVNIESIYKQLLNGWSAEYALRIEPLVKAHDAYVACQWNFPQAYYSVLFTARALLLLDGLRVTDQAGVHDCLSVLIWDRAYPAPLQFWIEGDPGTYQVEGITGPVADLLQVTRSIQYWTSASNREAVNDRGTPMTHWLDVLAVFRNESVDQASALSTVFEPLTPIAVDGVTQLHRQLIAIVRQINRIHETWIQQAIGGQAWHKLLLQMPTYIQEMHS